MAADDLIFQAIFTGEGASLLRWDIAARCHCYSTNTKQPGWECEDCRGLGVVYPESRQVRGLYRGRSQWTSRRVSGEHGLADAQLTVPVDCHPTYVDERVRDRFVALEAFGDFEPGRVFFPAATAVPFLFDGVQRAWRVQLQGADETTRTRPAPGF